MRQITDVAELRELQMQVLDAIDAYCHDNNLTYFISSGTLLGAVRHGGYIPWDDDIDIIMPSDDYLKFREACRKSLSKEYYLQSHEDNPCNFICHEKVMSAYAVASMTQTADISLLTDIILPAITIHLQKSWTPRPFSSKENIPTGK